MRRTRLTTHCAFQAQFAWRIGLPAAVRDALSQSYERWDGKGVPNGVEGEGIPLAARIVCLADVVEVYHHRGGVEAAQRVARDRGGGEFDPRLASVLCDDADELLEGLDEETSWGAVIEAEQRALRQRPLRFGSDPGRCRCLPRDDGVAAMPRGAAAGDGGGRSCGRTSRPGDWTATPSKPCSRPPGIARRRGVSGRAA